MLTDIEIAQQATLIPIDQLAKKNWPERRRIHSLRP